MEDVYVAQKIKIENKVHIHGPNCGCERWWIKDIQEVLEQMKEIPRRAMWGAYCVLPGHKFVTQQEDEEIALLLRAHPVTNVPWIVLVVGMLILPSVLLSTGIFAGVPGRFVFVGKLVWYLVALMMAFEKFLYWYYSVFIVTNQRVVDIDFYNLLFRVITEANLIHIEEAEMVTGGFVRSVLQYGDVTITTASEQPSMEAAGVPYPEKVVDVINRLAERVEARRG